MGRYSGNRARNGDKALVASELNRFQYAMGIFDKNHIEAMESKFEARQPKPPITNASGKDAFSLQKLRISPLNLIITIATFGLWLPVLYIFQSNSKSGLKQTQYLLIAKAQDQIDQILPEIRHHEAISNSIDLMEKGNFKDGLLLNLQEVRLYEARQGSSITRSSGTIDAETKTGTVGIGAGLGGIGIGLAASKGQTTGVTNSTSVTKVTGDEMVKIDEGDFSISPEYITFIGEKFTKKITFSEILRVQVIRNEVIISSSENEMNSLFAFNTDSVAEILGECINETKRDFAKKIDISNLKNFINQIAAKNSNDAQPLYDELRAAEQEIDELNS